MPGHRDPHDHATHDRGPATEGDASGLPTSAPREPAADGDRQGIEMSSHPDPDDHATHDLELIAAFAAGDATGARSRDRDRAGHRLPRVRRAPPRPARDRGCAARAP